MPLYVEVPYNNPECHDQKELVDCTKDELMKLFVPLNPSLPIRIYRLFCFILFLGPLKIILTFVSFFLFYCMCHILPYFRRFFRNNRTYKKWALSTCKPFIRAALFSFGIVKINITGELHYDTRTLVCNHLSLLETVAILYLYPVSYLAAAYLKTNHFIKTTSAVFEFLFVDRSSHSGNVTEQLKNIQNDPSLLPVLIFPEGKVTNGDGLVGFRTGAFVSETPVQAITVRFRQWLCPKSMSTVAWNEDNWYLYCYQVYAIPFMTLDIDVLPPLNWKGSEKTAAEKAVECELQVANHLHTIPYSLTNKVLFDKPKQE